MRRLGIVLGILGSAAMVYIGYVEEQPLWNARADYRKYESVMALPATRRVVKAAKDYQSASFARNGRRFYGRVDYTALAALPPGHVIDHPRGPALDHFDQLFAQLEAQELEKEAKGLEKAESMVVSVNLEGVKDVTFDKNGIVSSVELSTGEMIGRADPPALRAYAAVLVYPIVGFLIPWGVIKIITWIGIGFAIIVNRLALTITGRMVAVAVASACLGAGLALGMRSSISTGHQGSLKQPSIPEEFVPAQTLQLKDNENKLLEVGVGDGFVRLGLWYGVANMIVSRDGGRADLSVQDNVRVVTEDQGFIATNLGGDGTTYSGKWIQPLKPSLIEHFHSLLLAQFQTSSKSFDDVIPREELRLRNRQGWEFASMGLTESGDPGIALADAKGVVRGVWVQRRSLDSDWWEFSIFDKMGCLRVSLELHPGQAPNLTFLADQFGLPYVVRARKLVKLEYTGDNSQNALTWLSSLKTHPTRPVRLLDNRNKMLWSAP
jgi:hypothetical protein